MAKVVYGPLISDARRKIGGSVFTKVRAGSMVRTKVSPVQPRTTTQRNVRADFTALAKAWSGASMDDTKRAAWNALAQNYPRKDKFGAAHVLTGLQMFMALNRNLAAIGAAAIYDPPATLEAGFPGALTVTATAPGTLSVAPTTEPTVTEHVAIYAAAQSSPGRLSIGKKYREIAVFFVASPWNIAAMYTAKFGTLIAGKKIPILVKYITFATGAAGQPNSALQVVS